MMNDKYESIKKCNKCNIIIKPECDTHKHLLLEKYTLSQLEEMEEIKNKIKVLKKKLVDFK